MTRLFCAGILATTTWMQAQTLTVLHTFTGGADGYEPYAGVTLDQQGRIYGTTIQGGSHDDGVVFRLVHEGEGWSLSPIYSFGSQDHDGYNPVSRVVFGPEACFTEPPPAAARAVGERFSACNLRQPLARHSSVHGLRPSCTASPMAPMAEIRYTAT